MTQSELVGLSGDCTVASIHQYHRMLSEAFRSGSPVMLDLAQVQAADVSLAQLIVSAAKTAISENRAFALRCVSAEVRALLCSAGIVLDLQTGQVYF